MDDGSDKFQINLQKLTPLENFVTGVASGCIEVGLLQPLLFCKNASQQSRGFSFNPRLLYRGVTVSMVNMGVLTGLQFPLTSFATRLLSGGEQRRLTDSEMVLSGAIGGFLSGLACTPMELVLIQQQNFGGTIISTPAGVINKFGFFGLGRGTLATCGRESAWCCGYMGLGPALHRTFKERYGMQDTQALLVGSVIAGIIIATVSHPLDTVKTCMQGDLEKAKYKGLIATTRTLSQEGFQRFFWGWGWRTTRTICGTIIFAFLKHNLTPKIVPHHFQE